MKERTPGETLVNEKEEAEEEAERRGQIRDRRKKRKPSII